jgi:myosin VIIa
MRIGYMRLQALIRSRVLSHRFRHLRGHIVGLQARCRGFLVRREYGYKMWAIVKIQAHMRRIIAMRRYKKLKLEYRRHREAMRLKMKEEEELKHQGNKRAKEIAEKNYLQRLNEIERREMEEVEMDRLNVEKKKILISDAARKQDEPVDDGKLVEAMFDFLPDSSSEAPTPHNNHETSVFNDLPSGNQNEDVSSNFNLQISIENKLISFAGYYWTNGTL